MSRSTRRHRSKVVWAAVGISVVIHLIALLAFLPPRLAEMLEEDEQDSDFEVTTTVEEADELEEIDREEREEEELAELEEEELEEQEEEQEQEEEDDEVELEEELDRKVVQQKTNEEDPEEADFLSQEANQTDEQTRAEETTDENTLPGDEVPEEVVEPGGEDDEIEEGPEDEPREQEMASRAKPEPLKEREEPTDQPEETHEPEPEPEEESTAEAEEAPDEEEALEERETVYDSPVVEKKKEEADPREIFEPSAETYDEVFGAEDDEIAKEVEEKVDDEGRKLMAGWKERQEAVRASLENHITEVKPGNHTSVNAKKSVYADYIGRIHRKIHTRWGEGYLLHLERQMPRGHPLNDPNLNTTLEFVIEANSGDVESVNIVDSSGETMFDAEAVAVSHRVGPHQDPPDEIISPDGRVYIHWNFWRDQRQCGPFGASVYIVENGAREEVEELEDHGGRGSDAEVRGGGR